jgi:hypothetical protein
MARAKKVRVDVSGREVCAKRMHVMVEESIYEAVRRRAVAQVGSVATVIPEA